MQYVFALFLHSLHKKGLGDLVAQLVEHPDFNKSGRALEPSSKLKIKRNDLVAQLVEQYTFNVWALGSSPSQITKKLFQK